MKDKKKGSRGQGPQGGVKGVEVKPPYSWDPIFKQSVHALSCTENNEALK
jgi:hypothetical protein